jgi:hypothetical protein
MREQSATKHLIGVPLKISMDFLQETKHAKCFGAMKNESGPMAAYQASPHHLAKLH